MTIRQAIAEATTQLEAARVPSPKSDAQWLLVYVLRASRAVLLGDNRELTKTELEQFQTWLARRVAREPLQWIIGSSEFYGLELKVQAGVLIPRPETERLVELTLERLPQTGRVVDIGCGTGAIALALKAERPKLEVWATDISPMAIELTKQNAQRLNLELCAVQTSLLDGITGKFSAIISNPPYLPDSDVLMPEVRLEPREALYSGADGLGLARQIIVLAKQFLEPHGWLMLELDPRNAPVLQAELQALGWQTWLAADLAGRERFVLAREQEA